MIQDTQIGIDSTVYIGEMGCNSSNSSEDFPLSKRNPQIRIFVVNWSYYYCKGINGPIS